MTPRVINLGLLFLLAGLPGCGRQQIARSAPPTNVLNVHLQEGFSGTEHVIVTVDGRVVYRGTPKTLPRLGIARAAVVSNLSAYPIVTFTISGKGVGWSNQVDLSRGATVGISLRENKEVQVVQASGFGYE